MTRATGLPACICRPSGEINAVLAEIPRYLLRPNKRLYPYSMMHSIETQVNYSVVSQKFSMLRAVCGVETYWPEEVSYRCGEPAGSLGSTKMPMPFEVVGIGMTMLFAVLFLKLNWLRRGLVNERPWSVDSA